MPARGRPAFAIDDWMLEQQLRAEMEAEAWRRLRSELAVPQALPAPEAASAPAEIDHHRSGSIILKGLVRFGLAASVGYLAFIAALDAQAGEFEIWMAVGAAFLLTLAASMFDPLRRFVHFLAETARWVLILGFGIALAWFLTHPPAA